ncbi:MAG: DUF4422 domain-containing protein [Acetivibrio sp.]
MNIKLLIAAHKAYQMPQDPMYLPIHVGKEGSTTNLSYIGDNGGDNISLKNSNYCELTAIYWAYKNLSADYIGLVHYRRHFTLHKKKDKFSAILTQPEAESLLSKTPIILPKKRHYFIETNYSHYIHAHHKEGIDRAGEIIKKDYPDYFSAFETVMNRTSAHMFNMFIMRQDYFNAYCTWLFDILFQLEKTLDISSYSVYEARVFGFVSERLLDVWLEAKGISYQEIPIMFMESQNWFVKGFGFLKRKVFGSSFS